MFPDHGNAELTGTLWRPGGGHEAEQEPEEPEEPEAPEESADDDGDTGDADDHGEDGSNPKRRGLLAGGAALVVVLLVWLGTLPSIQTILRQSFTQLPTPYTEMYFSGTPTVSGITLSVPVTVVNHATTQDSFTLKVWTQNAAGKTDMTTSIKVTPKHGEAVIVVKVAVQMPADAQVLWINLAGQSQTLHYRIAGEAIPSPTATPSATATAKH